MQQKFGCQQKQHQNVMNHKKYSQYQNLEIKIVTGCRAPSWEQAAVKSSTGVALIEELCKLHDVTLEKLPLSIWSMKNYDLA